MIVPPFSNFWRLPVNKQITIILISLFLALSCNLSVAITINPDAHNPDATDTSRLPQWPTINGFNQTCPAGQVQTGYYNGQPVCINYNMACPAGQSLNGIDASTGSPVCVATSASCPANQVMVGTQCQPVAQYQTDANCPSGQVLQSVSNGNAVCVVLPVVGGGVSGGGPHYVNGTGCGACPYGYAETSEPGFYACYGKNQDGSQQAYPDANAYGAPVCQALSTPNAFSFMTY